jgi:hypothetical protein
MFYIIPIMEETLDMIEPLNNGVRPVVEAEATAFIYNGRNGVPEIVPLESLEDVHQHWDAISILYHQM